MWNLVYECVLRRPMPEAVSTAIYTAIRMALVIVTRTQTEMYKSNVAD